MGNDWQYEQKCQFSSQIVSRYYLNQRIDDMKFCSRPLNGRSGINGFRSVRRRKESMAKITSVVSFEAPKVKCGKEQQRSQAAVAANRLQVDGSFAPLLQRSHFLILNE